MNLLRSANAASRQLVYELISGGSGLILALFMWGHMMFVGSILALTHWFDWLALQLEIYFIAQPTVVIIFALFLVHAVLAARKIPAQLEERRKIIALGKGLILVRNFPPDDDAQAGRNRPDGSQGHDRPVVGSVTLDVVVCRSQRLPNPVQVRIAVGRARGPIVPGLTGDVEPNAKV